MVASRPSTEVVSRDAPARFEVVAQSGGVPNAFSRKS
jgi:hypothetical protein